MDYAEERRRMVETQLTRRGIRDQRVLAALEDVPREAFVPPDRQSEAFLDGPLPIGHGQTISQPYTVAFMAEALQLEGDERVLEIGTGCGYSAAVLGQLADEVHTVERLEPLAKQAEERLARLRVSNVHVHIGDGTLGLPQQAPFDCIVVTAGAERLPDEYVGQLREGGRIVIPIGRTRRSQTMHRFTLRGGKLHDEELGMFAFVPLIGARGWDAE